MRRSTGPCAALMARGSGPGAWRRPGPHSLPPEAKVRRRLSVEADVPRWPNGVLPVQTINNRPQHVLDLACQVFRACLGGLAVQGVDGELSEHLTSGLSAAQSAALRRSTGVAGLLALVRDARAAVRLDLASRP